MKGFRPLLVSVLLLAAAGAARADTWVPYTDGRVGGCWINNVGFMYGCTPQPAKPAPAPYRRSAPTERTVYRDRVIERGPTQAQVDRAIQRAIDDQYDAQDRARYQQEWERQQALRRQRIRQGAEADSKRITALVKRTESCKEELADMGFKVMSGGACMDKTGAFVNCPACPD